jgi:hypothetical protein
MTYPFWSRKWFAFIVATAVLAGATLLVSNGLTRPKAFPYAAVSGEWQCSKTAGLLTICTRTSHADPAPDRSRNRPVCLRRA